MMMMVRMVLVTGNGDGDDEDGGGDGEDGGGDG